MAADLVVLGTRGHTLTGSDHEAEVVIVGWPEQEALFVWGLSEADVEGMLAWYDAIAGELGMHFRAQRQGAELTLRVYR